LQNSPLESSFVFVALTENYSISNPLKFSLEKSQILSCDTVVANERYVQAQNRIPPLFERSKSKTVGQSSLAVYLKEIMQYEECVVNELWRDLCLQVLALSKSKSWCEAPWYCCWNIKKPHKTYLQKFR